MVKRKKVEEVGKWETPKMIQAIEIPNSDYINLKNIPVDLQRYNLKSITIVKGRNTVIEVIKEA